MRIKHLFFLCLLCTAVAIPVAAQGFGMVKMTATLQRRRPPAVYLTRTAIAAQVQSSDPRAGAIARDLEDQLENELCRNDNRLSVNKQAPQTLIQVTVNSLDTRESWIVRNTTEYKKVGERQEWNKDKNRYDKKDVYDNVPVQKRYKVLDGNVALSFRGVDTQSSKVLASGTANEVYKKEFLEGKDAPLDTEVQQLLLRAGVRRVLPNFVPTVESVEVQLPKGKLEKASKLGQSGLWSRMMETLETMEPLKKPEDEAYRLYDIGLANEALAYAAEDLKTSKKLLEQAAIDYGKAIDLKPDEKYFREPQLRIQTALTQQGRTEHQVASVSGAEAGSRSAAGGAAQQFTNQQVIDLVKSGLDEGILIDMINQAPAVQFDLSPQGTMALLQSKVSNKVIAAMRAKGSAKH